MNSKNPNPKRKVLIIANLFHASPRITRLSKHLSRFGWAPTIITPKFDQDMKGLFNAPSENLKDYDIEVIQTGSSKSYDKQKAEGKPYTRISRLKNVGDAIEKDSSGRLHKIISKLYWRYYNTINFPDLEKDWKNTALDAAEKKLSEDKFDLILSSSSPIIAHIVASELKKRFGIPWIGEYRDLWTLNHNYQLGPIMKILDRRLEKKTMRSADALITTTRSWADELKGLFPEKQIFDVSTGFDTDEIPANIIPVKKFAITYTGQIYWGKQNPEPLFHALSEMSGSGELNRKDTEIRFFGPMSRETQDLSVKYGIEDLIAQKGVIPRNETILKQAESQILLFLNWSDESQKGWLSLKFIEYLGAKRPILMISSSKDNLMAQMMQEMNLGEIALTDEDALHSLRRYYSEYLKNGSISFNGNLQKINDYNIVKIAERYSEIMNNTVANPIQSR